MQYIYIWHRVDNLTDSYHPEGGCAVVAESLEAAREMLPKEQNERACEAQTRAPDAVYALALPTPPKLFIFPDSGCC